MFETSSAITGFSFQRKCGKVVFNFLYLKCIIFHDHKIKIIRKRVSCWPGNISINLCFSYPHSPQEMHQKTYISGDWKVWSQFVAGFCCPINIVILSSIFTVRHYWSISRRQLGKYLWTKARKINSHEVFHPTPPLSGPTKKIISNSWFGIANMKYIFAWRTTSPVIQCSEVGCCLLRGCAKNYFYITFKTGQIPLRNQVMFIYTFC